MYPFFIKMAMRKKMINVSIYLLRAFLKIKKNKKKASKNFFQNCCIYLFTLIHISNHFPVNKDRSEGVKTHQLCQSYHPP